MLKNINKGFTRIAIVLWVIYAIATFYMLKFDVTYKVGLDTCFFMLKHKLFTGCSMFFSVLWFHIKILSYPLIFFFVIAFIWKGFTEKFKN